MRKAREEDIKKIHEIYMAPEVNPFMNFDIVSVEKFAPILQEFIHDLWIWEEEDIIGVLALTRMKNRRSHVLFLSKFALSPNFAGQGFGKKIINQVISDAKSSGIKKVELMVEEDNQGAIEFYKKLGFVVEGKSAHSICRDGEMIDDYYMGMVL